MKKLILLSTLILSSSVLASTQTTQSHRSLATGEYQSKQMAYEAGFKLMEEVRAMDASELKRTLPIHQSNVLLPSIKVEDMTVTVEEFASERGQVAYKALVNVDYEYQYRESNNS